MAEQNVSDSSGQAECTSPEGNELVNEWDRIYDFGAFATGHGAHIEELNIEGCGMAKVIHFPVAA